MLKHNRLATMCRRADLLVHKTRLHLGYYSEDVHSPGWPCQLGCPPHVEMTDLPQTYDRIIRPIEDRMIRSIWRIVRNRPDAEDAMQDALLTVVKRWDRILKHPSPQSLVLKICIDAAYDVTRRTVRQRQVVELGEGAARQTSPSPLPFEETASREQYAEIMTAIHRLPRQQATAILMRAVQGQPYEEIAAALGCTETTARKHVARSRQRLRVWLAHLDPENAGRGRS